MILEGAGSAPDLRGVSVAVPGVAKVAPLEDGTWRVEGVPPGTYSLQIGAGISYEASTVGGVVVTLDDVARDVVVPDVLLRLARGGIRGVVQLEGEDEGAWGGIAVQIAGVPGSVLTDARGVYSFNGVPVIVGSYALTATRAGYHAQTIAAVNVKQGEEATAPTLVLPANPGTIYCSVVLHGAAASSGVTVTADGATLAGSRHVRSLTTTAAEFSLTGVPAGTYNVSFAHPDGYGAFALSVTVLPGAEVTLPPVVLEKETGGVVGTATLAGSTSSAGIQVSLIAGSDPAGEVSSAAVTDAAGAWRVSGLAVGDYLIRYRSVPGYRDVRAR